MRIASKYLFILLFLFYFSACSKVSEKVCDLKIGAKNSLVDCDPSSISATGLDYYRKKQYAKALKEFDRAVALKPDESAYYLYRGAVYYDQQKYDLALKEFSKSIIIDPDMSSAYYNRGSVYLIQSKYHQAIDDFAKVISINPDSTSYRSRGFSYLNMGEYEKALNDLNQALKMDQDYAMAYTYRGRVYQMQNKTELALADFNKSIELDPKDWEPFYYRGELYKKRKKYDLALSDFDIAIQLGPDHPYVYIDRAKINAKLNQYAAARADIDYVLNMQLSESLKMDATNNVSWMQSTAHDPKLRDGQNALQLAFDNLLKSPNAFYFDTFAAAYAELGDFDAAIGYQSHAFELANREDSKWLVDETSKHLAAFKKKKPWRE